MTLWLVARWLDSTEPLQTEFEFAPISEDEFMAKCTPGTSRDIALGVRRVVSESLGIPYDCIYPEHCLVKDLGAE